ncbi:MAG TPA: DNA polymerase/3'-5' exonuclease PolX [Candidatus Peribacterales bacterium]|nr:DNA polymerase/3'-5' exonuclease PolX [Candidatus Peribacterales bacterium]
MTNAEIAAVFARIALILDLQGENPFRVRAYERAAVMIQNLSMDLRRIYEKEGVKGLQELPGIGKDLSEKIEEMIKTGKLTFLTKLEKKVPIGLLQLMEIEGIGPKRTKQLYEKFKIKDLTDLEKLIASGKIEKLPGWGKKSVENLLRGIDQRSRVKGRLPIGEVWSLAQVIAEALRKTKLCTQVEIAGSLRRGRDTIGDLDFLVASTKPDKVMEAFCNLPEVESITAKGETKSTVFLKAGLDADLRVVDAEVFGAALHYFTGSKDHNVHIRKIGIEKGLTISEYGVYKGTAKNKGKLIASRTEEDVYKAVGLPFIPPELREDRGEIEAAQEESLPHLIEERDLRSDLHMHSTVSDGTASIEEMAKAAKERGFEYIAMTDHASPMGMVKGIKNTPQSLREYLKKIAQARKKVSGIHILTGSEVDILKDGSLYLPDELLKELDFVIAAIHQNFHDSPEANTKRLIRACENPYVHALGHPTTRLLGKRMGIEFDVEAVLKAAKENDVWIELNASHERLDLPDVHLKRAKELGVKVMIGSDAHSTKGLDYGFGIMQARRGWLEKSDVVNCGLMGNLKNYCRNKGSGLP